ncbi:hypothetical protein ENUP19_0013G0040 [Entamoeba nuttalli]
MKQNEKAIGRSLKEVPTINKIPYPIYDMLEKLSSKWEYILTEGIFRVPGNMTDIIAIKKQYENGESVNLNNVQISTVASLLKNYLKEIPGFLVNNENKDLFNATISMFQMDDSLKELVIKNMKDALSFLPFLNYITLKHVIFHLHLIAQYSQFNLMDSNNLATVFAPVLFSLSIEELMNNKNYAIITIKFLIDNYNDIFTTNNKFIDGSYLEPYNYQIPFGKCPKELLQLSDNNPQSIH